MLAVPTPEEVKAAREAAGLSQAQAAELVGLSNRQRWAEVERGQHRMHPAAWELFCIKIGGHPDYKPVRAKVAL